MNVAGIDVSTKAIDLVLLDLDTDRAVWRRYELEGADLVDRVRCVAEIPTAWYEWDDVVAVGIERPAGRFGVAQVSMAFGAVLARIPRGKLVKPWQPAEWRKQCGLPGNATKVDVATWVCGGKPCPADKQLWPQDAFDAYCIARATRSVLELADGKAAA